MNPRTLGIFFALSVLTLILAFILPPEVPNSPTGQTLGTLPQPPSPPAVRVAGQAAPDFRETGLPALAAVTPFPLAASKDRSPLADPLHAPERSGMHDLAVVLDLFTHYREKFGSLPSGENNAQILNALTGNNPLRLALIERSHPAINPAGELTDRWGSPLFFHLIARDALEIRSAGPDQAMWTQDDLLTQSPSLRQP